MIRMAEYTDIPQIMRFVDEHWRKNHILARNKSFFEYFYVNREEVHMVLAIDEEDKINGILGFVPYGEVGKSDVIYALWKVIRTEDPFLGMKLMRFLKDRSNGYLNACIGINESTFAMYQWMGFQVGELIQWYRLSEKMDTFKIASVNCFNRPFYIEKQWDWKEYTSFSEFERDHISSGYSKENVRPYKPAEYVRHRYFEHPVFKYRIFGLRENRETPVKTFVVVRLQEHGQSCALRLIDCIGEVENIRYATRLIDTVLAETGAEYADFFETGISEEVLNDGGWLKVEGSGNIFPDYFAPYEPKNIRIYYSSTEPGIVLFKGDGDQDRPS